MGLSQRHQANLDWALGVGMTRFYRSSFGAMLERQWAKYVNPTGSQPRGGEYKGGGKGGWLHVHREADGSYSNDVTATPGSLERVALGREVDDYSGRSGEHDECFVPMSVMHVAAEKRREGSYEPELADLHRFGEVSSALYKLEKAAPWLVSVLMAYHGDRGSRWSYSDDLGEARLIAVYPLTNTGGRWVDSMKANATGADFNLLRDDERLASEILAQKQKPNDIRAARLRRIEDEARKLLIQAHNEYARLVTR